MATTGRAVAGWPVVSGWRQQCRRRIEKRFRASRTNARQDPAMPFLTLIVFTTALTLAAISPGPGMSAVVARALGGGVRGAVPLVIGIVLGDLTYCSLAIFGLAALAQRFSLVFTIVRYAGAAYLVYLAWRMWTTRPDAREMAAAAAEHPGRTTLAGLMLTLGNPKTIVFYMALLPTLVPIESIGPLAYTEIVTIIAVVIFLVGLGHAVAAASARQMFRSPKALGRLNRTAGVAMAGAAAAVVMR
jgi:threonine/homoserine/homoserine lactone efflux protein